MNRGFRTPAEYVEKIAARVCLASEAISCVAAEVGQSRRGERERRKERGASAAAGETPMLQSTFYASPCPSSASCTCPAPR